MRWSLAFILSSVAPSFLSRLLSTSRAAYSSSALILLSRFLHSHRARLYMFLPLSRSFNKNRQCQASVFSLNSIVFFIDPFAPQYTDESSLLKYDRTIQHNTTLSTTSAAFFNNSSFICDSISPLVLCG